MSGSQWPLEKCKFEAKQTKKMLSQENNMKYLDEMKPDANNLKILTSDGS